MDGCDHCGVGGAWVGDDISLSLSAAGDGVEEGGAGAALAARGLPWPASSRSEACSSSTYVKASCSGVWTMWFRHRRRRALHGAALRHSCTPAPLRLH